MCGSVPGHKDHSKPPQPAFKTLLVGLQRDLSIYTGFVPDFCRGTTESHQLIEIAAEDAFRRMHHSVVILVSSVRGKYSNNLWSLRYIGRTVKYLGGPTLRNLEPPELLDKFLIRSSNAKLCRMVSTALLI